MSIVLLWIITQIVTESFPVSSSSHIKLLEIFLAQRSAAGFLLELPKYFDDFLHGPTLIVLAVFFFHRWYGLVRHCIRWNHLFFGVVTRTALASTITVFFYFLFQLLPIASYIPLGFGLLITMTLLFSLKWCQEDFYEPYTLRKAALLGIVQGLALLPGISRLGSTYVAARWLKLSPRHAMEASFAMQVPLMIAAFIRASVSLLRSPYVHQLLNVKVGLVMLSASIVAYAGLWVVMYLARVHKLWFFAWYMIIPLVAWLLISA
jgi:undecaprenyl-diphosphatase